MLISQTLSPIVTPALREALLFGGARDEWERIFDEAAAFKRDEAVLRVLENEARREEHRREQERRGVRCVPAPGAASVARPHIFRTSFYRDIGGVSGESDTWIDGDFVAVDGTTGKLQSWIDYVDQTHLLSQTVSGNQCALPASNAGFASAKTAPFAASVFFDSSKAPSLWSVMNSGAGVTYTVVFSANATSPNQLLLSTGQSGVATVRSIQFGYTGGTLYSQCFKTAASSNIIFNAGATVTAATPTYFTTKFASSASPNWSLLRKSAVIQSGAQAFTPDSGAPPATLRLGASTVVTTNYLNAAVRAVYIRRRSLNAAESALEQLWIQKDTGITP